MNEDLWTKGTVETTQGLVAWPGITRTDANKLPRVATHKGPSENRYRIDDIWIAHTPFVGSIDFKPANPRYGHKLVELWVESEYSRKLHGKEYPIAEDLAYYEFLFETFLGTAEHTQRRPWGTLEIISKGTWFNDPSIFLWYAQ